MLTIRLITVSALPGMICQPAEQTQHLQSMLPVEHGPGECALTQEKIGTRYVAVVRRTLVDSRDPADIRAANEIQGKTVTRQGSPGAFEMPNWDQ